MSSSCEEELSVYISLSKKRFYAILDIFLTVPEQSSALPTSIAPANPIHIAVRLAFLFFRVMSWPCWPPHSSPMVPPYHSTCPENPLHPRTKTKPYLTICQKPDILKSPATSSFGQEPLGFLFLRSGSSGLRHRKL